MAPSMNGALDVDHDVSTAFTWSWSTDCVLLFVAQASHPGESLCYPNWVKQLKLQLCGVPVTQVQLYLTTGWSYRLMNTSGIVVKRHDPQFSDFIM